MTPNIFPGVDLDSPPILICPNCNLESSNAYLYENRNCLKCGYNLWDEDSPVELRKYYIKTPATISDIPKILTHTKICVKCKIEKNILDFKKSYGSHRHSICKHCENYLLKQKKYNLTGIPATKNRWEMYKVKSPKKHISDFVEYTLKEELKEKYDYYVRLSKDLERGRIENELLNLKKPISKPNIGTCKTLKQHHIRLKADPERLSSDFLKSIIFGSRDRCPGVEP